jgi:hypothetical protein
MTGTSTHADEVPTDSGLVRRLLEAQFPQWAAPGAARPARGRRVRRRLPLRVQSITHTSLHCPFPLRP